MTVPYISPLVYKNGIENTITGDGCRLAVVLLDNNDEVLATSAIINSSGSVTAATSSNDATYYKATSGNGNGFILDDKVLTIPTIPYTSTKSVTNSNTNATKFAVLRIAENSETAGAAYEGSGYFKYPNLTGTTISGITSYETSGYPLIVGSLTGNPVVNVDSNFRLTSTTITFTETTVG